jgi:hypothetical protein
VTILFAHPSPRSPQTTAFYYFHEPFLNLVRDFDSIYGMTILMTISTSTFTLAPTFCHCTHRTHFGCIEHDTATHSTSKYTGI